jgi:hypothetical protein
MSGDYAQQDPGPSIAKARAYWVSVAAGVLADPSAEPAPLPSSEELFG